MTIDITAWDYCYQGGAHWNSHQPHSQSIKLIKCCLKGGTETEHRWFLAFVGPFSRWVHVKWHIIELLHKCMWTTQQPKTLWIKGSEVTQLLSLPIFGWVTDGRQLA